MSLDDFQSFFEQTRTAQTVTELVEIYLRKVEPLGYDKMMFCLLSDHAHIGLNAGIGYLNNYPEDWMKYYIEKKYAQIDPVISYCRQRIGSFTWDEMNENLHITKSQRLFLNEGKEAELFNGVCTPLWGPHSFAGVGLATSEQNDSCDKRQETLDLINAYSNQFYLVFQKLHNDACSNNSALENVYLTERERSVLTWAAKGKSNNDIADILCISLGGVKFHLDNIYKKLQVHDRVVACTKAIALGLIHP